MPSLYDLTLPELEMHVSALGFEPYRARQVWDWAYRRLAPAYDGMLNVPAALRERLAETLPFPVARVVRTLVSDDGLTRKRVLALHDGKLIESVLMLYDAQADARGRATVCISSQAGCAMGCVFCATGQSGFERNLSAGEVVAQAAGFARELAQEGDRLSNVVFMGMGEPLANYAATMRAVDVLHDAGGFGVSARQITVSTVGHVAGIRRLAAEPLPVGLAVSLHAPDQALRERLIPTARRYPLAEIIAVCREYIARTRRRLTFEYCLIAGVNDAPAQARALAALVGGLLCHVNLIPVNPTGDAAIRRPSRTATLAFQRILNDAGVSCTVRVEKGVEIGAACGQLRHPREASVVTPA